MDEIISRAYGIFASYAAGTLATAGSDCSPGDDVVSEIASILVSKPLRDLSGNDLLDYYYLAIDDLGTVTDFKHYLPRIMELIWGGSDTFSLDVLLLKLDASAVAEWPLGERTVLREFFANLPEHARSFLQSKDIEEVIPV